jgi:hypothetical protein
MTILTDLNGLSPADHNATPWVATRDGSWTRLAGAGVNPDIAPSRGASERARGQVVRPSALKHLDGTPAQSSLSRCSSSGSLAMLTAMRRASSFVLTKSGPQCDAIALAQTTIWTGFNRLNNAAESSYRPARIQPGPRVRRPVLL